MIPLFRMHITEWDTKNVARVIERQEYWAVGEEISEFEGMIADFIGTKYAVCFNSGTSALHAILLAYNIGKGDEVIVPSFTFQATANMVEAVGAKPVFADIETETFGLSAESVDKLITSKTRAIMPIHYAGAVCRHIEIIKKIAKDNSLLLLEDAAQSFGAALNSKKAGTFGDAAMFSFCQDKIISSGGEGGVVVTDDEDIYQKLLLLRSHGRADDKNYFKSSQLFDYITLGYNWRMPTICAALGIAQLNNIHKKIQRRQEIASYYINKLIHLNEDIILPVLPASFYHVYQKFTIRVLNKKRDMLQKHLADNNIFTKAYFGKPVHKTAYYQNKYVFDEKTLQNTNQIAEQVLSLPMSAAHEEWEIKEVVDKICEFYQ